MTSTVETERLTLKLWEPSDAEAALAVYAAPSVSRWLTPELQPPPDTEGMGARIHTWRDEDRRRGDCAGHWAVLTRGDEVVVGGLSLQYVPAGGENLTLSWALAPGAWGRGYAAEAGGALIRWAIHEVDALEVFAILRPDNDRAVATARRMGMDWVTDIGDHRYRVYRIRHGDLAGPD